MPKTPKTKLETLIQEHAELYRKFLPTLKDYQGLATKALMLQVDIFHEKLRDVYKVPIRKLPLIVSVSARETPAHLEKLLAALCEEKVEVAEIIYDPKNFTFLLYGKVEE